ncbi:hypothetical protein [Bradyrhizobium betae]|uniref:hypothetical protein n=1 Tax=Bradyrhizobium betae TaxID=244734 RepID=UPI0012B687B8|nr:hypothetical protein [Bradyrhizobium betae]MCS3725459.1 hypothetical protein [Bradyrhizobium betae]
MKFTLTAGAVHRAVNTNDEFFVRVAESRRTLVLDQLLLDQAGIDHGPIDVEPEKVPYEIACSIAHDCTCSGCCGSAASGTVDGACIKSSAVSVMLFSRA